MGRHDHHILILNAPKSTHLKLLKLENQKYGLKFYFIKLFSKCKKKTLKNSVLWTCNVRYAFISFIHLKIHLTGLLCHIETSISIQNACVLLFWVFLCIPFDVLLLLHVEWVQWVKWVEWQCVLKRKKNHSNDLTYFERLWVD